MYNIANKGTNGTKGEMDVCLTLAKTNTTLRFSIERSRYRFILSLFRNCSKYLNTIILMLNIYLYGLLFISVVNYNLSLGNPQVDC